MEMKLITVSGLFGMLGCAATTDTILVEPNALGVSSVRAQHTTETGDPLLIVTGYDAAGDTVASLRLRTGQVLYSPEPESMPAALHLGTDVQVTLDGHVTSVVTPDVEPHRLLIAAPDAAAFVRLTAVEAELDREAGLLAPAVHAAVESTYTTSSCSPWMHPTGVSYASCCFDNDMTQGIRIDPHTVTTRYYSPWGAPCRTSTGGTDCTDTECTYGPCGFAASSNNNLGSNWVHMVDNGANCNYASEPSQPPTQDFGGMDGACGYTHCSGGNAS